jgi:hypothetical protein
VSAPLLYSKTGFLSRIINVEYEGFKFGTYEEDLNCTFHMGTTDGVEMHKIIVDYVADMIDFIYPNDEDLVNDTGMQKAYMVSCLKN